MDDKKELEIEDDTLEDDTLEDETIAGLSIPEDKEYSLEEIKAMIPGLNTLSDLKVIADNFEGQLENAPLITEEVGQLEKTSQPETLKKAAYYAIFSSIDHEANEVGSAIKSVHVARFETKAQLRKVIEKLDESGFKLIDILKGRPLLFSVVSKKVHEITIGD